MRAARDRPVARAVAAVLDEDFAVSPATTTTTTTILTMLTILLHLLLVGWASTSTEELLRCRANLTADIKNEDVFAARIKLADYIFTGKIRDMSLARRLIRVKVKRTIKGQLDDVDLLELQVNDTCAAYIRPSYTGIFLGRILPGATRTWMHFGPVPLTLANLDRVNAAIKGTYFGLFSETDESYSAEYCGSVKTGREA